MTEWETAGAAILAGIVLLGAAVRALPPIWSFIRALSKMPTVFDRIMLEFSPNHGTSMRDVIDRLERSIQSLKEDAEHLRVSNHQISGTVTMAVSAVADTATKIDQHTDEDAKSFGVIMTRLDTIDSSLAAAKHDLEQFNEIDQLGREDRIERRHGRITDLNARLDAIHNELRTLNDLTVGGAVDADERRRIEAIPEADRTEAEQRHLTETETP